MIFSFVDLSCCFSFLKFSVPLSQPTRNQWIQAIEKHQEFNYHVQSFLVCSLHFKPTDLGIRGKGKSVIKGKIPSIFQNYASENLTIDSPDSNSIFHDIQDDVVWPFGEIDLEFDSNNINSDNLNTQLTVTDPISKEKYKELVDKSVELVKCKLIIEKLQEKVKFKTNELKELKNIISDHKYLLNKKKKKEKKPNRIETEVPKDHANNKQCNVSKYFHSITRCISNPFKFKFFQHFGYSNRQQTELTDICKLKCL